MLGWTRGRRALANCVFAAMLAGGCSEDETPVEAPAADGQHVASKHWIPVDSPLTPPQWLVSPKGAMPLPAGDPAVRKVDALLASAHARYRESERMIANRTMQLESMLGEIGIKESNAAILEDLAHVAGEAGQTEGFGAISQHYYNMRAGGLSREAALSELQSRYGRRP